MGATLFFLRSMERGLPLFAMAREAAFFCRETPKSKLGLRIGVITQSAIWSISMNTRGCRKTRFDGACLSFGRGRESIDCGSGMDAARTLCLNSFPPHRASSSPFLPEHHSSTEKYRSEPTHLAFSLGSHPLFVNATMG